MLVGGPPRLWLLLERTLVVVRSGYENLAPMPLQYSPQFYERLLALVDDGHDARELASGLGIAAATIYRWHRQARIDSRVNSVVASELAGAKRPSGSCGRAPQHHVLRVIWRAACSLTDFDFCLGVVASAHGRRNQNQDISTRRCPSVVVGIRSIRPRESTRAIVVGSFGMMGIFSL